jgi:hypothetical protein
MTECILALAYEAGNRAALIDAIDGTATAWPRFARTVRAAAHGLSQRGLAVGVFVQDAASFAVALNAIRAAGAFALPIRSDAIATDIAAWLNACGARLLITAGPLAELATEAADRSRVRQVFSFGEAGGTTPFSSLLTHAGGPDLDKLTHPGGPDPDAGLTHRDVVVAAPPCGDGQAYTALLDLTLLTGATIVAAPVPLVTAAMRVYQGTAAIVPRGTHVPGIPPARVFTVA